MGQTPDEIRREIEDTRDRMTETAQAIGYRADVKTRAKEAIVEKKDSVVEKGRGAVSKVTGAMPDVGSAASAVGDAGSSAASAVGSAGSGAVSAVGDAGSAVASRVGEVLPDKQQIKHAVSVAQSNPLGLVVGSIAVGFLAGMLIPSTRVEDEKIGTIGDELREQARAVGQEALQHGREVAESAAQAAVQTAQQEGGQHGHQLSESLQESAREVKEQA